MTDVGGKFVKFEGGKQNHARKSLGFGLMTRCEMAGTTHEMKVAADTYA